VVKLETRKERKRKKNRRWITSRAVHPLRDFHPEKCVHHPFFSAASLPVSRLACLWPARDRDTRQARRETGNEAAGGGILLHLISLPMWARRSVLCTVHLTLPSEGHWHSAAPTTLGRKRVFIMLRIRPEVIMGYKLALWILLQAMNIILPVCGARVWWQWIRLGSISQACRLLLITGCSSRNFSKHHKHHKLQGAPKLQWTARASVNTPSFSEHPKLQWTARASVNTPSFSEHHKLQWTARASVNTPSFSEHPKLQWTPQASVNSTSFTSISQCCS